MSIAINQFEVVPEQSPQASGTSSQTVDKSTAAAAIGPSAEHEQAHLVRAALRYLGARLDRVRAH